MNSLQVPLPAYWPLYPAHRGCAASVSTVGGGAHSPITIGLPAPASRGRRGGTASSSGTEADFVWSRGARAVGIEVKASTRWRPELGRAADLHRAGVLSECFGIYLGERPLRDGPVRGLPLHVFARDLAVGRVLRTH